MRTRRVAPDAGFTLLEIMLALAIFAFITTIVWGTFSQTARVKQRMEAAQDRTHTVRVALTRMAREIEMAFLSLTDNPLVQEKRTMFVGIPHADFDELRFSWFGHQRLRADSPEGDTALLRYYVEPDPETRGVMNLMRRETRRLEPKDPLTIMGEAYVLCPNVARLKFSFYDFRNKQWKEEWNTIGADGQQYPPTHVRISLTVIDERGEEVTYTTAARVHATERLDYRPGRS